MMRTPLGSLADFDFALLPLKIRNRFWDRAFYDVRSLTPDDWNILSPLNYREGEIIVVSPSGAGRKIRRYQNALRFMNKEGQDIRAIVLAGVGSSVLGTAALARNVADTYNYPVAGIVTGYGGSDLITEALGGWFVFGQLDRAANTIETLSTTLPDKAAKEDVDKKISAGNRLEDRISNTPDVATLVDILLANPPNLELLVGHSKGSLLIDFALGRFVNEFQGDDEDLFERLKIVTLGAVVSPPEQFTKVRQIIGALDWFGGMNSNQRILPLAEKVPGAWHHLNPEFSFHLNVSKALRGNFAVTRS